jgi:hypothetical protein
LFFEFNAAVAAASANGLYRPVVLATTYWIRCWGSRRTAERASGTETLGTASFMLLWGADVKIPPSIVCVKREAQDVVLTLQIPMFQRG